MPWMSLGHPTMPYPTALLTAHCSLLTTACWLDGLTLEQLPSAPRFQNLTVAAPPAQVGPTLHE